MENNVSVYLASDCIMYALKRTVSFSIVVERNTSVTCVREID